LDAAAGAQEQLRAQPVLQIADMAADSGMGDEKLSRRLGEAPMPGGGLKGLEGIQRWKSAGQS
jgi:hypothetical protein